LRKIFNRPDSFTTLSFTLVTLCARGSGPADPLELTPVSHASVTSTSPFMLLETNGVDQTSLLRFSSTPPSFRQMNIVTCGWSAVHLIIPYCPFSGRDTAVSSTFLHSAIPLGFFVNPESRQHRAILIGIPRRLRPPYRRFPLQDPTNDSKLPSERVYYRFFLNSDLLIDDPFTLPEFRRARDNRSCLLLLQATASWLWAPFGFGLRVRPSFFSFSP